MIEEARNDIGDTISRRLKAHQKALSLVKGFAILGGALLAGIAQFFNVQAHELTNWQIAGLVGTAVIFFGGVYVLRTDSSAPEELERARRAIEMAADAEREAERASLYAQWSSGDYSQIEADASRARELYLSMHAMRGALERLDLTAKNAEETLGKILLASAFQHLPLALGFEMEHQWTYGVYRAVEGAQGIELILAAERRAIECDPAKARRWPTGTGYVGAAHQTRQELVIGDTSQNIVRTLFSVGNLTRPGDMERYISVAAVPILVGEAHEPWGVAIATTNQVNHFSVDEEPGVHASEAVRAIAGMAALGASIVRRHKQQLAVIPADDGRLENVAT